MSVEQAVSIKLAAHEGAVALTAVPKTIAEAVAHAKLLIHSELVPKDFRGKLANAYTAIQFGAQFGLRPAQSLQRISVINGRPALWGDAMLGICEQTGELAEFEEDEVDDGKAARCRVLRKKKDGTKRARTIVFSMEDARTAGLLTKPGPWKTHPKRMMQLRARAFGLRDTFSDVLSGLYSAEEAQDLVDVVETPPETPPPGPQRKSQQPEKKEPEKKPAGFAGPQVVDVTVEPAPKQQPAADEPPAGNESPAKTGPASPAAASAPAPESPRQPVPEEPAASTVAQHGAAGDAPGGATAQGQEPPATPAPAAPDPDDPLGDALGADNGEPSAPPALPGMGQPAPEPDVTTVISRVQRGKLLSAAAKKGANLNELVKARFDVDDVKQLPAVHFDAVMKELA